jgi:hypothetical protein
VTPKTLRAALNQIQTMLDGRPYSAQLWDVLVALRGPDSRTRQIKNATTAVIRTSAFPKRPCLERSVYAVKDTPILAKRRKVLLRLEQRHFREHVSDAFLALGLKMFEVNQPLD